jgi:hypothetical protein
MLTVYQPDGDPPPPEILDRVIRDLDGWNRALREADAWVFTGGLHPASTATTGCA